MYIWMISPSLHFEYFFYFVLDRLRVEPLHIPLVMRLNDRYGGTSAMLPRLHNAPGMSSIPIWIYPWFSGCMTVFSCFWGQASIPVGEMFAQPVGRIYLGGRGGGFDSEIRM